MEGNTRMYELRRKERKFGKRNPTLILVHNFDGRGVDFETRTGVVIFFKWTCIKCIKESDSFDT